MVLGCLTYWRKESSQKKEKEKKSVMIIYQPIRKEKDMDEPLHHYTSGDNMGSHTQHAPFNFFFSSISFFWDSHDLLS